LHYKGDRAATEKDRENSGWVAALRPGRKLAL
jgi:hypothetical protein